MNFLRIKKRVGKYEYVIEENQTWIVRTTGLISLLTVGMLAYGYYAFIRADLRLLFLSAPFILIVFYFGVNALLQLFFKGFSSEAHAQRIHDYWQSTKQAPAVSVLIPVAGEPLSVVTHTVHAAAALAYANKAVYILDDTKQGMYEELAEQAGVGYVHRPKTGVGKKSGNLNYALKHIPESEHVLVLDADFVPRTEMLHEIIPYTADDIAIIQTPQHFILSKEVYAHSKIAYGAGYIQREFYRLTQQSRNRFGSAICVGTNALYNRHALKAVHGYAEVDHSEDVNTGLKMLNHKRPDGKRYRIEYLPIQLATGTCPDTYKGFYKQQSRWATGSLRLVASRKTILSRQLRPAQRLIYFSNCLYYLYTMGILFMPLQLVFMSLTNRLGYDWRYSLLFLPQMAMRLVAVPHIYHQERKRLATMIVTVATAYTFLQALYLLIIRKPMGWEATGVAGKAKHNRFYELKVFAVLYFLLCYVGSLAILIMNDSLATHTAYILQAMFVFAFVSQAVHLVYLLAYGDGERPTPRFPKTVTATLASVAIVASCIIGVAIHAHTAYNIYLTNNDSISVVRQLAHDTTASQK